MDRKPINLAEKFARFSEHWSPKIIAEMNDYHFMLVKFQGEFVWHDHSDTDEVSVGAGEMLVIPKGEEHKTSAEAECKAMLVEMAGTVNTGGVVSTKTAPNDTWV